MPPALFAELLAGVIVSVLHDIETLAGVCTFSEKGLTAAGVLMRVALSLRQETAAVEVNSNS
jgi:hypothetical protein